MKAITLMISCGWLLTGAASVHGGVLNAQDYGAVGDDKTDNTVAFSKCLDAVVADGALNPSFSYQKLKLPCEIKYLDFEYLRDTGNLVYLAEVPRNFGNSKIKLVLSKPVPAKP